jgi:asparagine synthase (glutamine-hydrolysing)
MCGLVGFASRTGAAGGPDEAAFRAALQSIHHRGPDGAGVFHEQGVWLGHARLSILDLSSAGAQPMHGADGRQVLVYNGEIYNFRELATAHALQELRSRSDTEVLLRLFAARGTACLPALNGMFAFALYDRAARKLWLARDRMGIKPLYYRIDARGLAFASEVKAILALDAAAPVCDTGSLHEWLYYGASLGGRTLYAGIRQLLPGQYLEFDLDGAHRVAAYHSFAGADVPPAHAGAALTADAPGRVRDLLEQAVRRQLVSDVPVGVFLSGGVDSSAITAFASRHYQGSLATYSVGFDFAGNDDELPQARRIAAHFGTDHHEIHISGTDVGAVMEKLVHHHDAPFADAANIPLYMMAEKIRSHTKVVLQGDGGDELFGGYRRYATLRRYHLLHALAGGAGGLLQVLPRSPAWFRAQRYLHAFAAPDVATTLALLLTQEDPHWHPAAVFAAGVRVSLERADPFARFREVQPAFAARDLVDQMSLTDLCIELPDRFLEKVDRATMAASLEVRVPFLDHELVDHAVGLPAAVKMPGGQRKGLLKQALQPVLPAEVLRGPKKGFTVPYGAWLMTSLKPMFFDHLQAMRRTHPDVLDAQHIENLFARTARGQQNHSFMLWKLLNFMIWAGRSRVQFTDRTPH